MFDVARSAPDKVFVLVGAQQRASVELAKPESLFFSFAPSVQWFLAQLTSRRWAALVIDPELLDDSAIRTVSQHAKAAKIDLLFLAADTLLAAVLVGQAARVTPTRVFVGRAATPVGALAQQLGALGAPSARAQLLTALASRLELLPLALRLEVLSLFSGGRVPTHLAELAAAADCSRRTFDRYMARAGFHGGRRLLCAIRAAHAWEIVQNRPAGALPALSRRAGYSSERQMRTQIRQGFGRTFEEFVELDAEEAFVGEFADWVLVAPEDRQ